MVSVCTIMIVKNVDKYKQTLCEKDKMFNYRCLLLLAKFLLFWLQDYKTHEAYLLWSGWENTK